MLQRTHPHQCQRENEHEVGGEDNQEIHRSIPSDGVEDFWDTRVVAVGFQSTCADDHGQEGHEIYTRLINLPP